MPIEDKYFRDERIIKKAGSKLSITEIKEDFEKFVGYKIKTNDLGFVLKAHGFRSSMSNGVTYYKGKTFSKGIDPNQDTLKTKQ